MNTKDLPLWQRNFQLFAKSYPIIQLSSCIQDLVPYRNTIGTNFTYVSLNEWIWKNYSTQEDTIVVFYSSLTGFSNPFSAESLENFNRIAGHENVNNFTDASQHILKAFRNSNGKRIIVVFDSSLRWLTAGPIIQPNDQRAFTALKCAIMSENVTVHHQLIFINEKSSDLPTFMLATQSHAKSIIIPKPDQIQRSNFLEYLFSNRNFTNAQISLVAQRADNLTLNEIRTALTSVDYANCTPSDLINQISLFQFGFSEDPWQQIDPEKIDNAETILGEYVFGQDDAIRYSSEIVKFAASGFGSVFQEDGRTAPKGVLFFCGLSGTGKTELAKAIARLVFGSADSMIRFDMGEYNQPHSAERLTGSPPGYVGHDAGGQLTEAIKAHPFCLLLFDEIEKADPTVMNKFLSILEDGRLTDGKGETVSFENTIIVFTSNIGAAEAAHLTDPSEVRQTISDAVKRYCEEQPPLGIGKPELYSRLAGNIVVFNPLNEEAMQRIFDNYYSQTIKKLKEQLSITVSCSDEFLQKLRNFTNAARNHGEFPGGRGMKKAMDKYFRVPLSSFSQKNRCSAGDTINITDFEVAGDVVNLQGTIEKNPHQTRNTSSTASTTGQNQRGFSVQRTAEARNTGTNRRGFKIINKNTE